MDALLSRFSMRTKMLLGYFVSFMISVVLGNMIIFLITNRTIEGNTERELTNSTNIIMNMVKSATDASIRNHLRAIAEKNRDIVQYYYDEFKRGSMGEAEAKQKAGEVMLSQVIGKTGYIYGVNSKGILQVHPKINGADLSNHDFIYQQSVLKEGYLEYEWANPGEQTPRRKALYMTYFGPWDWIISVSSYREEFTSLFRVNDFRDDILSVSFGKTGYPYVMDSKGNLIIHPKMQGQNIYGSKDLNGREFIKDICVQKSGKIIYPWQNPEELVPRDKLVIFNYIPELDWIVASSSYLEEFNGPLITIGYGSLITLMLVALMIIPFTLMISTSINRPIQEIMHGFSLGAKGDYSSRLQTQSKDEIGQLALYFNDFMSKLSESNQSLQASEERFRLLFENAVEGVITMSADGRFVSVNPSMVRLLGYESREQLLREVSNIGVKSYMERTEFERLLVELENTGVVSGFETLYRRRDGSTLWVSLNARAYTDVDGTVQVIEGFCNDITEKKKAEDAQNRVKEELEQRVIERTAQLSDYIGRLEQRNTRELLLRDMGALLQVCRSMVESYNIIDRFVGRFFPETSGKLYLFIDERRLESIISWGEAQEMPSQIERDECWGLRQGKLYSVCDERDLVCRHIHPNKDLAYVCMPLVAQGEVLGLFHLSAIKAKICLDQELLTVVTIFTDHLGLSLANLKLQDRLRNQSFTDPLTGLYNRRFMEEFAYKEIERIKREKSTFSMILMDVDHFKRFNDTYGHDAGDLVLKELAAYFQKQRRMSDIACRYGGEEFVLLLPKCASADAVAMAEELCKGVREKLEIVYGDINLTVTVSMGVATIPQDAKTFEGMIKAADDALYRAKEGGRDRVVAAGTMVRA